MGSNLAVRTFCAGNTGSGKLRIRPVKAYCGRFTRRFVRTNTVFRGHDALSAQIKNAPRIRQGAFSLIKLLLPVGAVRFYVSSVQIGDECQFFRLFFGERACIYSPRPVIAER